MNVLQLLFSRRRALLHLALLTAAVVGCADRAAKPSNKTPVFLISVDTLRSDHLPAYGYSKISTPNLDAFRNDSILFERAYSHCPLTLPSHATLLTGMLPADTGIRDNVGYRLEGTNPTLAELLKKNGYATGAAISSFVLRKQTQINRGFDFYDDEVERQGGAMSIGRIQRAGPETVAVSKRWIQENERNPLLYLLHLYEPHTPYEPPEPYKSRYGPYDGEIAYTDTILGDFLDFLKGRGLYDKSLILVFSDHGEGLNEHKEDEHGIFLYREAIQVPLLLKLPGKKDAGKSVATPVQLSDIFPTVLEQTATSFPAQPIHGTSLLSFLEGGTRERFIYSESYYPKFHFGWSDLHSLTDGRFHVIQAPTPELYDLEKDFGETSNVLENNRRSYTAMRRILDPLIREAEAPAPVSTEEASKLAALGYLGGGVQTAPGEVLPDPKVNIATFTDVRKAFTMARNQELAPALALTEQLLAGNNRMLDLWALKARLLSALGREREAINAAREGLRLSPNASHLAVLIANLSLELQDLDQAEKHAELVLSTEPAQAHEILARVWIARKDLTRAEQEARASLENDDDRVIALMTLARVEKERERYEEALKHLDAAVAALQQKKNRNVSGLSMLRGDVLARLGRSEEAVAAFQEEIRLFPEEPRAYKHLILLYVTEGRLEEGTELIHRLVDAAPTPLSYFAVIDVLKVVGDDRGARFWARRALQRFPGDRRFISLAG